MDVKANDPAPDPSHPSPTVPPLTKRRLPKLRLRIPGLARVSRTVRVLATLAVASATIAISGSWWYSCGYDGCPTVAQLRAWQPTEGGMLLDRTGAIIAPLSPVKRVNVPIARVPAQLQAAFIAVEDRRFRGHHGIDWYGVARTLR